MDNTFKSIHPNDNWEGQEPDNFFLTKAFKKLADKKVKKFTEKTAAKSSLSKEQQKAFVTQVSRVTQPVTTKAARSAALITSLGALTAGGFALAPLFAGGAAAAGAGSAAAGGSAAATGGSIAAGGSAAVPVGKKLVDKIKEGKLYQTAQKKYDSLPQSVKENLKQEATKVLADIKVGNGTAADLLPKTKAQKELEASMGNNGLGTTSFNFGNMFKADPIFYLFIGIVIVVIIGFIVKRNG